MQRNETKEPHGVLFTIKNVKIKKNFMVQSHFAM